MIKYQITPLKKITPFNEEKSYSLVVPNSGDIITTTNYVGTTTLTIADNYIQYEGAVKYDFDDRCMKVYDGERWLIV